MINRKFLTKLLGKDFRTRILLQNAKVINDANLKIRQYATYVIDKHCKDRDPLFIESREAGYGYSPVDVISFVSNSGEVVSSMFEFNTMNHFLKKDLREDAVDAVICILSELVKENKSSIKCFDIDKIDAWMKKAEEDYVKKQTKKQTTEETPSKQ